MAAATSVRQLLDAVWTASALAHCIDSGLDRELTGDEPFVPLLLQAGLLERTASGYTLAGRDALSGSQASLVANIQSTLGQAYAIAAGRHGWSTNDEDVLTAQGIASAAGGVGMATGIQTIPELKAAFADGGVLLDVGVGVAGLACAVCEALPSARVIGLDVLPQALKLAQQRVDAKGLGHRVELRQVAIEDFTERAVADLAHMSPVFIPLSVVQAGMRRIRDALRPGGWLVLSGIVSEGPDGAATRWMAHNAGGSALTDADVGRLAAQTGFGEPVVPDTPPGSPRVLLLRRADTPSAPEDPHVAVR
jgi:precorrin-6B methylase 2